MSERKADTAFENSIQTALQEDVQSMAASDLSRLRQAREQALLAAGGKSSKFHWWSSITASAVVMALMLAFVLPQVVPNGDLNDELLAQGVAQSDVELLLAADEIDLYDELEFLLWLDQQTQQDYSG